MTLTKMNINQLLSEIHDTGLTDEEIGSRIGTSQSIVFRLRTGVHKSTSFERGNRIQQLHSELVGNEQPVSVSSASGGLVPSPVGLGSFSEEVQGG